MGTSSTWNKPLQPFRKIQHFVLYVASLSTINQSAGQQSQIHAPGQHPHWILPSKLSISTAFLQLIWSTEPSLQSPPTGPQILGAGQRELWS